MTAQPLPFCPQTPEELASRFDRALDQVYTLDEVQPGVCAPGMNRDHVFDYPDGMRVIVSLDRDPWFAPAFLHVSLGAIENSRTARALCEAGIHSPVSVTVDAWLASFNERIRLLTGCKVPIPWQHRQMTERCIHHFGPSFDEFQRMRGREVPRV